MILKTDSPQNSGPKAKFVNNYLLYLLAAASEKASEQFHAKVRKAGLRALNGGLLPVFMIVTK